MSTAPAIVRAASLPDTIKAEPLTCAIGAVVSNVHLGVASRAPALVARNLSNKEIGLAMQVGEETIKWHMKNLFAKLDAGTRKQVVSRARILGLLADAASS